MTDAATTADVAPAPAPPEVPDAKVGLAQMSTVFAVGMTLAFKVALEHSYHFFLAPHDEMTGTLPHLVVGVPLVAVMLLGVRFFWVPRNLHGCVQRLRKKYKQKEIDKKSYHARIRNLVAIHFPLALLHAIWFFCVCEAYAEFAGLRMAPSTTVFTNLAGKFVALYGSLLLFNALWLLVLDKEHDEGARLWIRNNIGCSIVVAVLFVISALNGISSEAFLLVACVMFYINSGIDLGTTAYDYLYYSPEAP